MIKVALLLLSVVKGLLKKLCEIECLLSRWWVYSAHQRLFYVTWKIPKQPEYFDHHIDLYYLWSKSKSSHWLERGVFSSFNMRRNGKLLELSCGDGFNTKYFYSSIAGKIIACDYDKSAISLAKNKNSNKNIKYVLSDIRFDMPKGIFDNVVWDGAIEHFTQEEINEILKNIKSRLKLKGVFTGFTVLEKSSKKSLEEHKSFFTSKENLKKILNPYFKYVQIYETIYPERHNLYFIASNTVLNSNTYFAEQQKT
ncbi:MAG: hypothetical protein A2452_13505 [Candidatus Firestonebacteria bacterium RIFOXYC2_FULL_39_67]|nr:MAG: hypothetical protein A2452_13505 [Candidatus Firestonebacteria bacterium RIFOXYC2_FULL_39_67]OGF57302.1 MAG: hypothetical protein A2497_03735 [Candidatus Firestonebacteria bacterium RifOxyC12_full_39_7]